MRIIDASCIVRGHMADVFVSYSRRDAEFVERLVDSVSGARQGGVGRHRGDRRRGGLSGSDQARDRGLGRVSVRDHSGLGASAYCENEVEYARELQQADRAGSARTGAGCGVACRRSATATGSRSPRTRTSTLGWRGWWLPWTLIWSQSKAHTRWLVKALEWDARGSREELPAARLGVEGGGGVAGVAPEDADPAPTPLQREYLLASREAAARRQRAMMGGAVAIAAVSVGLLIFALSPADRRCPSASARGRRRWPPRARRSCPTTLRSR